MEELAGVPIRMDESLLKAQPELPQRQATIQVENGTVRDILDALLKKVGLSYRIETDGILIVLPKPKGDS